MDNDELAILVAFFYLSLYNSRLKLIHPAKLSQLGFVTQPFMGVGSLRGGGKERVMGMVAWLN